MEKVGPEILVIPKSIILDRLVALRDVRDKILDDRDPRNNRGTIASLKTVMSAITELEWVLIIGHKSKS